MTEGMDPALVDRLVAEMEAEMNRTDVPDGFPAFHDIPPGRYTSPEFFALEQEHLWTNSWICAGRVEHLPEPGSYFLFDELRHPLIVVRGRDGVVRCFSNTCRHRGAPVVREPTGTVRNLRCQYHAWTYDSTDGRLIAVTDERDFIGLCKDERALPEIACDTWGGWVWINMNPDATPLLDFLGTVADEMEQFRCADLRLVGTDHRVIDCNWKVAIEAFQEVYHFRFIHDRGGVSILDSRGATMGLLPHGNSRMVTPQSKHVVERTGRSSWKELVELPNPHGLDAIAGVHPIIHSTSYAFTIFPNLITPLGASGFPFLLFFPEGRDRTLLRIYHYAPSDTVDQVEAHEARRRQFAEIIDEDVENLDPMGRAMNSPLFTGVPLSYQERRIWHMNEAIDRTIGVERIPPELRVEQLLADHLE